MVKINRKRTILLIDDDKNLLSTLELYLKKVGYGVISAFNGMEGIKLLESADYDLVITDINMPYVSGLGVISILRENHPNIPVIAFTGFGQEPLEAAKEEKADVVLKKPIKMSILIANIEILLNADTSV